MKVSKVFYLLLYYGFARYLPPSHYPIRLFGGTIRNYCARHLFKFCGKNINIERGAYFGDGHGVEIGDNSDIGINCHVPNDIKIGKDVMMGPNCFFLENKSHTFDRTDVPMLGQGMKTIPGRTEIGDDVWIGRQALVLSCKKISSHSIVGAGSVVSKDVPEYAIVAGNPIRFIRDRRQK